MKPNDWEVQPFDENTPAADAPETGSVSAEIPEEEVTAPEAASAAEAPHENESEVTLPLSVSEEAFEEMSEAETPAKEESEEESEAPSEDEAFTETVGNGTVCGYAIPDISPLAKKPSRLLTLLGSHPYLCSFFCCLVLDGFCFGSQGNVPQNAIQLETLLVLGAGLGLLWHAVRKSESAYAKPAGAVAAVGFTALVLLGAYHYHKAEYPGMWMLVGGCLILAGACIYLRRKTGCGEKCMALFLLGSGALLKFFYVYYTSCYTRQHDVGAFNSMDGHAGYISYLLNNHFHVDFDPHISAQFYHPPLHHLLSAAWIWVSENIFGIAQDPAQESLQMLTLFYAIAITITAYKILKHFRLKGAALYLPLAIVSFHPCFILFAGSINNDTLSALFVMGAILCTLRWMRQPTWQGILKIALCIGLGMMTKMSAALVAIPVAVVFLIVLIQQCKQKHWGIFGQFCSFAVVCVPLGMWYPIRNLVKYGMPINYVYPLSPVSSANQYLGDRSFSSRIFDFSAKQVESVYEQWLGNGNDYSEYNPLIALLKNSLFGEYINEATLESVPMLIPLGTFLFWIGVILSVAAFVAMLALCFRKQEGKRLPRLFLAMLWAVLLFGFYQLSAQYPFTCSMNYRYITPTCVIGAVFLGLLLQRLSKSNKAVCGALQYGIGIFSAAFAVYAAIFYAGLGLC